jgi:two-component system, OmpR family, sensor histidine kinase KdpD
MLKSLKKNYPLRYALPAVFLTLAMLAGEVLHPLNPGLVEYTFLAGVVAAAWIGGRGPGLIAAILAPFVLDYFFLPPLHNWDQQGCLADRRAVHPGRAGGGVDQFRARRSH